MTDHVDRFHAAVSVMAGNGSVKQRLMKAYEQHLAAIEDDDVPIAIRQEFADLKSQMYRVAPLNGEGPICASVRKMSSREAGQCGVAIVSLYRELMRLTDANRVIPVDQTDGPAVPPFLVKTN